MDVPPRRQTRIADRSIDRAGFTVLELLTVTAIIGLLAAVVLPALGATREAAHRIQCAHQLRQVGLALHCYHDGFGCLPPGSQWEPTGRSAYGWSVPLLPYLDQQAAYFQVDRNQPLQSAANDDMRTYRIPVLICPSDVAAAQFELFEDTDEEDGLQALQAQLLTTLPFASYVGVFGVSEPDDDFPPPLGEGAFIDARPVRLVEFLQGLSNSMWVSERTAAKLPSTWLGVDVGGEDALCRLVGNAVIGPNCRECDECEFSSRHDAGINALFGDGRVEFLSDSIDSRTYQQLAVRDGQLSGQ